MEKVVHPTVVLGVPCYNEGRFIADTIRSIASQTCQDFKVLISDNASTDATAAIAKSAVDRDERFVYYRQNHNLGAVGNFNFIQNMTDSRYFAWIGAHDLLGPDFVRRHVETLENDQSLSLSQSSHDWIDDKGAFVETIRDGDLSFSGPDSVVRYLFSIRQNKHNIGANSVIRRRFMDDIQFTSVVGTDRILLSHLAYRGPFANLEEVLYRRRTFSRDQQARQSYMERLTGRQGGELDWWAFAKEYADDIVSLCGDRIPPWMLRFALWTVLRYYLPVGQGTLITSVLWTIRRIVKRLPFLPAR